MFERVANAIAAAEAPEYRSSIAADFYQVMTNFEFLPNSPTLANAGTPDGQLSACFVLPVPDDMGGIFATIRNMALVHKSGGGTGFSFSGLRPRGSPVGQYGGTASGPVSFMRIFDTVADTVRQGGMRHGANMGVLSVDHPDVEEFITAKLDGSLTNFNISVGLTDAFMSAVRYHENPEYTRLWKLICESAHQSGDPGVLFMDRINSSKANPVPSLGPIRATNPCGEQPLYDNDSCNLGSINLSRFVKDEVGFDWHRLAQTVYLAVRFLDDVVSVNCVPLPQMGVINEGLRRIGLGVMGWADALFCLGIPYSSQNARDVAKKVMGFIQDRADDASRDLAKERGSFLFLNQSIYSSERAFRNATRTTIAPTGTISIIAGCSSGIEPVFALAYKRQHKLDHTDPNKNVSAFEINPIVARNLADKPNVLAQLVAGVHISKTEAPESLVRVFETAHDISPEAHLLMQAAFQQHTDNAVSKTINLSHNATPEDISRIYLQADELGLMGVTVYRDGSKAEQVFSAVSTPTPVIPVRRKQPKTREAVIHKFRVGNHQGYLTVGLNPEGEPMELFLKINREGNGLSGFADAVCIATSIGLQYGISLDVYVKKYKGTRFEPSGMTGDPNIPNCTSVLDYVFRWLEQRFLSQTVSTASDELTEEFCPCGGMLIFEEGCWKCYSCGESRC